MIRRPPSSTLFPYYDALPISRVRHLLQRAGRKHRRRAVVSRDTPDGDVLDRKSTRLNSSHVEISYAVFCLKKKSELAPACWTRGGLAWLRRRAPSARRPRWRG